MKAVLEFVLPDEDYEHRQALSGTKYKAALDEIDDYFRKKLKYENLNEDDYHRFERIREDLRKIVWENTND